MLYYHATFHYITHPALPLILRSIKTGTHNETCTLCNAFGLTESHLTSMHMCHGQEPVFLKTQLYTRSSAQLKPIRCRNCFLKHSFFTIWSTLNTNRNVAVVTIMQRRTPGASRISRRLHTSRIHRRPSPVLLHERSHAITVLCVELQGVKACNSHVTSSGV